MQTNITMPNDTPASWRRYNIFISSTFKDMDFERDIIRFRVIPALNRRFRDRRVELQAIDLRLGVNTSNMSEEESERKVLSVCTSCIDSARPFFIGLIGKRYGWIPPLERWKEFLGGLSDEEKSILRDTAGCSVTEMEIVYGALSQQSFDTSHILFYLRDDESYDGMPEELKSAFCDTDPENLRRLERLKEKVRGLFERSGGQDDRCTRYRLSWADGQFSSDAFESLVTEQLASQIELETAREAGSGADSWWAQEKELEESTLLRLLPGSIDMALPDDGDVGGDASGPDKAVWYVPGFGASTRMAREYAELDGDGEAVRLLAVFGLSEHGKAMRPVLVRWIHELAAVCGREDLPPDEEMLGKMPQLDLDALFGTLVEAVRAEGKYIYVFMDDVEALELGSPQDLYMTWLDRVEDDVNIYVNLQDGSEAREKFLKAHPNVSGKLMIGVQNDPDAAERLISSYEKSYFLELPHKIRRQMLKTATSRRKVLVTLKAHSVFRLFEALTQEDFSAIRARKGSQIDAINSYLEDIWKDMPDAAYDIMTFMVNGIAANLSLGEGLRQGIWTIAAAPGGLRESDIAFFAGQDWDCVQFYRAMNFLQDFFYEDRTRHIWKAKYLTLPEDGLQRRQKDISEYLRSLDGGDSLRETMGLYYALACGEPSQFASYMVEGDYLHGQQMSHLVRFHGPQIRLLLREGFFRGDGFEHYCKALPAPERLQLMISVTAALAELPEERIELSGQMARWLDDVRAEDLSGADAFALASILAAPGQDSLMGKALEAAQRSVSLGFPTADGLLAAIEQKSREGKPEEEDFFEEYFRSYGSLPASDESFLAIFKSADRFVIALMELVKAGDKEKALREGVRFMDIWQRLSGSDPGFFKHPKALEKAAAYYMALAASGEGSKIGDTASELMTMALARLKTASPDNPLAKHFLHGRLKGSALKELAGKDDFTEKENNIRQVYASKKN